jgi:hypothetical protein
MSTQEEFNALAAQAAPPPKTPEEAPQSSPSAPQTLPNDYMAHTDQMRHAANADSFNAILRGTQVEAAPKEEQAPSPASTTVADKAGAVAKDIGTGIIEAPRAVVKGIRDAYQSMIDLAGHAVDFAGKELPQPSAEAKSHAEEMGKAVGVTPERLAEGFTLPDISEPKSVTGTIEKNIVQFVTGLRAAGGQIKSLGIPEAASALGERSLTALKGFVGQFEAFDGSQQNLSNLIQSVPALKNPVTKFMATDPNDSDAVNRLKSAVEGTVGAQLIDAFVGGLRFLRQANDAKSAAENAAGLAEGNEDLHQDIPEPTPSRGMTELGNPLEDDSKPLVSARFNEGESKIAQQMSATGDTTPQQVVKTGDAAPEGEVAGPVSPGATEAQAKEPGVYVNFARINGPDDIKRAMSGLADTFKENIDDARRGVQSFEDTKLGADAVNAWDTLMSRRVGEPLNAEQSLASRQLWASSASKTMDLAQIATAEPTPENLFAFRKMLATHAAIQEQVIAARTETARSLSSWRIPAGDDQGVRLAQMMQSLNHDQTLKGDGLMVAYDMANRVKALQTAMDVEGFSNFAEKGIYATTRDAALEAWTNGLLTSPLTHVKVGVSNAATVALRIGERAIAEKFGQLLGQTDGVAAGEAAAQYSGLVGGLKDAFRYAGKAANAFLNEEPIPPLGNDPLSNAIKAAKTGQYSAEGESPDQIFGGAISSQAFNIANSGWVGQGVDLMGQLVRSPGRALTAEHDFFRSIGYRMELNALATRQAAMEANAGKITQDAVGSRIQEIIANPPPSVSIGSADAMAYQTFTDAPGKLADLLEQARNSFPMLRVILPFYKIPSRILSFTFERSPIAPLMGAYQANIAAGGAREQLARAQVGLGTAMMLATADAVLSGQLTGSGPPQKAIKGSMENTGWLPYSVKVGDHWVQYNKLETVGSSMAMAADVVETLHGFSAAVNGDDPDVMKLAMGTTLAIAQDITSKTYLQGLSNMFEMMASPKTEGQANMRSFAGSLVPAGLAAADRVQDPYQRAVYSMMDAIKARTPGASETLPPVRDKWGQPVQHGSGLGNAYDLLSPFATKRPQDSPIDKEIVNQGMNINLPEARTSFGQGSVVNLQKDPAIYSRYVELAGNGYKDPAWGLGAKDLLNQVVSGNHPLSSIYNMKSDGPDGGKADMIRSLMNQYRDGAKRQLLQEYPKLQEEVTQKAQDKQALRMPTL